MYSVSEAYITQMMQRSTRRRLTGTIGSVAFTGADIVQGSFAVSGRAAEESDTKIGGVYLGQLDMTFTPSFLSKVARDQYNGKVVTVAIGLWVEDAELEAGGSWVDVPIGVYTLQSPKISKQGVAVTGYDNMQKLDKKFAVDETSGTPFAYLSYIATQCGVTLGQTEADIEAMPNGTELLGLYTASNDIETYRDLLYWLAQTMGGFACADRSGRIVIRKFGTPNSVAFDEMHRDTDVSFSGYTTKWTGVSFVDIASQSTMYYGLPVDDGLTMNMGTNPLLQTGSQIALDRRRRAVLAAVAEIQYTPYYVNSARDCIFDLGDEINFTGGISGNCTGCVMAYEYTLDNYSFEGYGDDPLLTDARSKNDKNIAGLIQQTTENEIVFYNYSNLMALSFGSEIETTIANLSFVAAQKTTVKIMLEFIFDMVANLAAGGSYELKYYLDNNLLSYSPYEQIGANQAHTAGTVNLSICRDFFYIIKEVEPNDRHTFRVTCTAHNIDSVLIDVNHAHVTVEGQRLYSEQYFDGYVEILENIAVVPYGYLSTVAMTETVSWWMSSDEDFEPQNISENVVLYDIKNIELLNCTETVQVLLQGGFPIFAENGDNLVAENGDRIVSE